MCDMHSPVGKTMLKSAESLLTISDSIAIEILDKNVIITSVGNELHLHESNSETKVLDVRLKNKVHGIIKGNGANAGKLLVFGEKEFMIIESISGHRFEEQASFHRQLTDWISAGIFYVKEKGFLLLTAHSVLLEFNENDAGKLEYTLARRVSCVDKSTLYCAHLHGSCWHDLVIFGGNAFGELLIWQPKNAEKYSNKNLWTANLQQRISSHNGVIFSIDYDSEKQLLISTSDDRSIRFWHVSNAHDWSTAKLKPLASGYGHMARVFQGKIIDFANTSFALTIGEDSYFCLWRCNGELLFKQRHQFGAVIWRLAYDAEQQLIYTVGSTGNVLAFELKTILNQSEPQIQKSLTFNEADSTEYIAKIKFLTKNQLVGITNRNRLLLYNLRLDKWKTLAAAMDFKCTVLEVYNEMESLIAVCGFKYASVYEFDNMALKLSFNVKFSNSIVRSFHFLGGMKFLMSDDVGNCMLLKYDKSTKVQTKYAIELPKSKERWLTAAISVGNTFLLVSNRLGNLILYKFEDESETYELKSILKHPHGYLGATLLKIKELKQNDSAAYVQSAGHDNTLKVLKIDLIKATLSIQNQQQTPVAWIEATIENTNNCWQTYLGFNDNHFVVWSTERDISLQVSCGGGHRCWHFCSYSNADNQARIRLVFIKNKKVLLYDYAMYNESENNKILPIKNRWHTRPCNVLEVIEKVNESLLISAGDDNLIKVHTLQGNRPETKLMLRAEIQTHISNIRALKILSTSPNECLIFSGGGRAQLCLTALDLQCYRICEIFNFKLKANDDSTTTSKQMHSFDPEMRIMSIDVLQENQVSLENFEIYVACSDGYIRKLKTNITTAALQLEELFFYGKCLLQLRLIVQNTMVLTAATDGYVTLLDSNLKTTFLKLSLHSSGINALDLNFDIETKLLRLLTGGDDQAVVFTKICYKNQSAPLLVEKLVLPQLHTAQVTAVRLIGDGLCALTSSVDQNLVHFDLEAKKVISTHQGCVADVKGAAICSTKNICLVYGCGLQIFQLTS